MAAGNIAAATTAAATVQGRLCLSALPRHVCIPTTYVPQLQTLTNTTQTQPQVVFLFLLLFSFLLLKGGIGGDGGSGRTSRPKKFAGNAEKWKGWRMVSGEDLMELAAATAAASTAISATAARKNQTKRESKLVGLSLGRDYDAVQDKIASG